MSFVSGCDSIIFTPMANGYTDKVIISVGGSLIVPNGGVDTAFLSKFNKFVRSELANNPNRQFFLAIGGGQTTRLYQKAAREVIGDKLTRDDLDWIGIHATRLNAHLVRAIFRDVAHQYIIKNFEIIQKVTQPVVIASGWKPGWSTDYDAILLAEDYQVEKIVNLTNTEYVYDKDPKKFPDAKPIENISWNDFRKLVGNEWIPGMNAPFDPIAAKKAEELNLTVVIAGADLENLEKILNNKPFKGTTIESISDKSNDA